MKKRVSYYTVIMVIWGSIYLINHSLNNDYHFMDDHSIIKYNNELKNSSFISTLFSTITTDISRTKRLRPVYFLHRLLQTKILGTNLFLWSFYLAFLAILTTILFFESAVHLNFSYLASSIFALLLVFGEHSTIFWQLGPAESFGYFLLALGLFCLVKKDKSKNRIFWSIAFMLNIIAASLCKESFILMIPALIYWDYLIYNDYNLSLRSLKYYLKINPLLLILVLFFILSILFILKSIGTIGVGYAGIDGGENFGNFLKTLIVFLKKSKLIYCIYLIVAIGLLNRFNHKSLLNSISDYFKVNFSIFILSCLILTPQIILYTKSGMVERYLVPSIMALGILILYLSKDAFQHYKKCHFYYFFFIVPFLLLNIRLAYLYNKSFVKEGIKTTQFLNKIIQESTTSKGIVIVANPYLDFENVISATTYLTNKNQKDIFYYFEPINPDNQFEMGLTKKIILTYQSKLISPDTILNSLDYLVAFMPNASKDNSSRQILNSMNSIKYGDTEMFKD